MSWQDNAIPADSPGGWQSRAIPVEQGPNSVGGAVAKGLWNILPQNPKNLVNNIPLATGAIGGVSPVPFGATAGTAIGQGARDLILKGLNKPIPSGLQHGLELGGAALGDVTAFPAMNRSRIGSQIGEVEARAGVPPVHQIPSLPKPASGEPVSGGIDNAIAAVERAKAQGAGSPVFWKQIKDQVQHFYALGKNTKLSDLDQGKLTYLNAQVQKGLNAAVPGRGPLAADLARSQIVPNAIRKVSRSVPWWGKAAATALGGDALLRVLGNAGAKGR